MIFKRFAILLLALPLLWASQSGASYEYRIGPKDLLEIRVFEVPELNITVRVAEDGTITLPLLGKIEVQGLTRFELEKKIASLLEAKYLKNAQVNIFIKEYQSKKVSVIGAVKNPGTYELVGRQTLLQVLSLAGGLTEEAGDKIIIIRQYRNGKTASLIIDLEELMLKGNPKYNIPLQPDDIINIPAERYVDVYVFGQVKNPGLVRLKKSSGITLLQAIAQAGGFTDRANKSAVTITRRDEKGREIRIKVNVKKILKGKQKDIKLKPYDIVYVPESIL